MSGRCRKDGDRRRTKRQVNAAIRDHEPRLLAERPGECDEAERAFELAVAASGGMFLRMLAGAAVGDGEQCRWRRRSGRRFEPGGVAYSEQDAAAVLIPDAGHGGQGVGERVHIEDLFHFVGEGFRCANTVSGFPSAGEARLCAAVAPGTATVCSSNAVRMVALMRGA